MSDLGPVGEITNWLTGGSQILHCQSLVGGPREPLCCHILALGPVHMMQLLGISSNSLLMNHHQVVKLEELADMEQILQTICAELNGNRSSIVNMLRSIRVNNSIDRGREGYKWSYTLDNGAETNHCNRMVQFGFMEVCWCRTFDISIALPEYQGCDRIHSFEMTFDRYEKGAPLVVQDLKLSIQNRSVIR